MLLAWMAYSIVFGVLLYGAALAADRLAATWSRAQRFAWIAAVLLSATVPVLIAARPRTTAVSASVANAPNDARVSLTLPVVDRATPASPAARLKAEHLVTMIEPWLVPAWLGATLACLALFIRGAISVHRRRARWRSAELDGYRVLVASNVGPAVVGVLRPQIVIPEWAVSLDDKARALMLRHEAEHIRARDPLLFVGATMVAMLFPWNAALWLLVRRLGLAIEIDCDRRVIGASAQRYEYGMLLLTVGARRSASLPLATSLVERRPILERRIRAMTMIAPRHPRLVSAASIALALIATTAAVRAPHPAPLVAPPAPVRRGPDSLTVAEIRALAAAHHPSVLTGDPNINTITLVVDATGNYAVSLAESRSNAFVALLKADLDAHAGDVPRGRVGQGGGVAGSGMRGRGGRGGSVVDQSDSARAAAKLAEARTAAGGSRRLQESGVMRNDSLKISGTVNARWDSSATGVYFRVAFDARLDGPLDPGGERARYLGTNMGLNMEALSKLVDFATVDAVRLATFAPGELGPNGVYVYVLRERQ